MLESDKKLTEYIKDDDHPTFEFRVRTYDSEEYCQVILEFDSPVLVDGPRIINFSLAFNLRQTDTVGTFNEMIYEYEGIPIKDQKL